MDKHGNIIAIEGCDECFCGCNYWEKDRCIDCNTHIGQVINAHLDNYERDKFGNYFEMPEGYRWATADETEAASFSGDFAQMIGIYRGGGDADSPFVDLAVREGYGNERR